MKKRRKKKRKKTSFEKVQASKWSYLQVYQVKVFSEDLAGVLLKVSTKVDETMGVMFQLFLLLSLGSTIIPKYAIDNASDDIS